MDAVLAQHSSVFDRAASSSQVGLGGQRSSAFRRKGGRSFTEHSEDGDNVAAADDDDGLFEEVFTDDVGQGDSVSQIGVGTPQCTPRALAGGSTPAQAAEGELANKIGAKSTSTPPAKARKVAPSPGQRDSGSSPSITLAFWIYYSVPEI